MELINEISNKLFNIFYVDDKKYGRQQKDGSYKLIKETITVVTIDDMLENQKSLLTYQELHVVNNARIKWICIDLDIAKKEIDSNLVNPENLKKVKKAADIVCEFLEEKKIPFFLEFSGRRGFHIWIIFEKLTSKENGYKLIEFIHKNVKDKFDPVIIADKFPKTPSVSINTKGIGFGVKLPLSQNKGNGKLSFFLRKEDMFDYDETNWISKPNGDFLKTQLDILNSLKTVTIEQIQPFLDDFDSSLGIDPNSERFLKSKETDSSFLPKGTNLDSIIKSLSKCEHLEKILYEYEKGISGKERSILVGLLINLKTDEDENFGYNILMELFSNIQKFDKEKTEKNLENLKYFQPITCKNLEKCNACRDCGLVSPVELIEGVNLVEKPSYSIKNIDEKLFKKLKDSLYQYSLKNDEVALYPQLRKLDNLDFNSVNEIIDEIYKGVNQVNFESYKFERNEINKTRLLYNLDPIHNVISTYFTFILNTIYYSEISNNSYGYQFSQSLYQNNLFNNWFANWAAYTRKIETVLFNEEYKEYFLLKIDIKSFYDKIDTKRLKIKLIEEAPLKIREKLKELSSEDNYKYKNIINYLIDLSSKTNGNSDKGLPQGPAYARYLAELYLNGLDFLIENFILENEGRGFYNRFVDDVFIFVESEVRAQDLFEKIKDWLSINSLELNLDKTKLINVQKYADSGEYHKFKDDAKYDINRVNKNKNVLSEEEIQEALSKLETLTHDYKFGLKDNLRFFYYQFKDDNRLDFIRKRLSKKLPFSKDGRGTLYMLFYADLLTNNSDVFWGLVDEIEKVIGLSFTHYLNSILLKEDAITKNIETIQELLFKTYSRSNLSLADKLLIATLCVKSKSKINLNYPPEIMNSALEIPDTKFEIEQWYLVEEKLQKIVDKVSFLKELDRIINNNNYTVEFLNELSSYSFIRFSEWSKKEHDEFIDNNELLILYYHCLCFLTLFEKSENHNNVKFSWKLLLENSVRNEEIEDKNYKFNWINKLAEFDFNHFSNGSYSLILNDKDGSELSTIDCKNEFLKQYKNVLLMLLFAKDKANDFLDFRKNIAQYIENKESLFYNWVINPNVSLYPQEDEVCLKNIALNGLIVLKTTDKFFVKSINKKISFNKYDYITSDVKPNEAQEIEYPLKTDFLTDTFISKSIVDVICLLSELIKEHEAFKDKFKTNYPVFYNPSHSDKNLPIVPYYSDFNEIINCNGNIEHNSINAYWQSIFERIKRLENVSLVADDNPYNFKIIDLDERFFPKSDFIINTIDKKIKFINQFSKHINKGVEISIFQYQYYWSLTVYEIADELIKENKNLINYLKVHFDTYSDENNHKDLFFSVDKTSIIEDENLERFFQTIKISIGIFQNEVENTTLDFVKIVDEYIPELILKSEEDNYISNINDFKIKKIKLTKSRDYSSNENETNYLYKLTLDEVIVDETCRVYLFNNTTIEFELIKLEDLEISQNKSKIYCSIEDKRVFVYIPENELIKAYERIETRKDIYDKTYDHSTSISIDFKKLFPMSSGNIIAEKIYDTFSQKTSLENKLKLQYSNSKEIRKRVVNWLSLLNDDTISDSNLKKYMDEKKMSIDTLYNAILSVLNSHYSMDEADLDFFKQKMIEYNEDSNYILFPIKNPNFDENGLFRLINRCEFGDRPFDYLNYTRQLFTTDCASKNLVIITDVSISGGQFKKAFEYYNKQFTLNDDISKFNSEKEEGRSKSPNEERYFTFSNLSESQQFRKNIENIEQIYFLSPIITEKFITNVTTIFSDKKIDFICKKPPLKASDYLFGELKITNDLRDLFNELIKDVELIKKMFNVTPKDYKKHIKEDNLNETNLLFRIGSLPAKHLLLFSLESKKGFKLLDYVGNWKNTIANSIPNTTNLTANVVPSNEELKISVITKIINSIVYFFRNFKSSKTSN